MLGKTDNNTEVNKKVLPSYSKDIDKMPPCFPNVVVEPILRLSIPSCSSNVDSPYCSPKVLEETGLLSQNQICSPSDIIPVPQVETNKQKRTIRNKGKTAVLTASPYYHELLEKNSPTPQKLVNTGKRNVFEIKKKNKPEHCQSKRKRVSAHVSAQGGEKDTRCIFCDGEFLKSSSGESWIACSRCERWAHEKCTAYDSQSKNEFICDFCE